MTGPERPSNLGSCRGDIRSAHLDGRKIGQTLDGWNFVVSSAYWVQRYASIGKLDGVPVKMQKAIRASREKCLALSASNERHHPKEWCHVDRGGEGGHQVQNWWYGREPKQARARD